ncbi:hypothetical protein DPMN_015609 [Dreissena polymorpha]|uniref:Uncharacterized protein n=1 Tax=Dreissena polymorpha TaxID=45954 RepID=A0A9D4NBS5_DREPO|nr:hypothetical protein DPMN_015609 [Dreissena polymorpha]
MNLLTKFHQDQTVNVASRVLTRFYYSHIRKNAPPLGSHFFQANIIIFELIQDIIETNLLTKFHEDWTINVASRVLTRKNAPPLFNDDRKINVTSRLKIAPPLWWPYIIGMNLLYEFHEDQTINVASIVKMPHPLAAMLLKQNIIKTNLLTIFHKDWTISVASRVLTRKNAPPPGGHVFQPTGIIFELFQDIIGMNLLTESHEDQTINVASRVLTRFYYSHIKPYKEKCPAPWQPYIIETNLLTKFHEDLEINVASRVLTRKNAPPPSGHVFQPTGIIFELVQDIIGMNLLTKFHEDQTINVACRVKNAPPLCSHVFQANVTIFELIQDIIETNLLTKFHEDWKINANVDVAQRTTHDGRRTKGDHKSSP